MVSIPLLEKEEWTRHQEMDPFRNGAAGVVSPARCQASTFRRTDHPVCGASVASQLSIDAAATPPFQGGECLLAICPPKDWRIVKNPDYVTEACAATLRPADYEKRMAESDVDLYTLVVAVSGGTFAGAAAENGFDFNSKWVVVGRLGM